MKTAAQEYYRSEFARYRAPGYQLFCKRNLLGYETIVIENAQSPTEALRELVESYQSSGEDVHLIEGGSVVLPEHRVIIAMQQLCPKGVDRSDTKQHLLRIAAEF